MVDYNSLSAIVCGLGYSRVLSWLGFSKMTEDSSVLRGPCAVHGGDRKDSFCMYKNTLVWRCFSHKCNETHGSSFFSLVQAMFKCSFGEALGKFCVEFAVDKSSFCEESVDENFKKDALFLSYLKHSAKKDYDLRNIKLTTRDSDYFLWPEPKGGGPFVRDILNFFNISKCYTDDFGVDRVLIPICDANNKLMGYSGRATVPVDGRKYLLTGDMAAGDILYNLNNAKNTKADYIIVVEGFKAVWRLHEYGYDNVVCCMGSLLKPNQVKLLIQTLKRAVLFLDPDTAGIQGTIITNKKFSNMVPLIPLFSEFDRDPADLTKEEVDSVLGKYKTSNKSHI